MQSLPPPAPPRRNREVPVGLEVSCRALEPYIAIANEQGYGLERLTEGLEADPERIASSRASLSWADFCLLTERIERLVGGDEAMRAAGTRVMDAPMLKAFSQVIVLFADVQKVYRASNKFSGSQLFRNIEIQFRIATPARVVTHVTIPEPYAVSRGFFTFLAGVFEATPRVLGLPDAVVRLDIAGRIGSYTIDHAPSATLWQRLRQVFRVVFSAKHTLAELELQNKQLLEQLAEVAEARRLAEETSRYKSEFLANISHELRTPLNPVMAAAVSLAELDLEPEDQERVDMVREGGRRMIQVVDQLLDFSDIDAGTLSLALAPFDLPASLAAVQRDLLVRALDRHLPLEFDVGEGVPQWVIGDERRLRQVVTNLADNAIKFTDLGKVSVRVRRLEDCDGGVRLGFEVQDTGPGIPAAMQDKLFEPFTQRDGSLSRRHGGTGLGLTIVRQLVTLMGGTLGLDSEEGVGSTFRFEVELRAAAARERASADYPAVEPASPPVAARRSATGATRRRSGPQRTLKAPPGGFRVLVAEDDRLSQRLLVRMLESMGCVVDVANDGAEALEAVNDAPYRVVFMDCQMPHMDGLEATRRIRDIGDPIGRVPVVAVTAHAVAGHREECLASGMDDYLTKPVDRNLIYETLERYLESAGV